MTFKDLAIGDSFDFMDPESLRNSFSHRCTKLSSRTYSYGVRREFKATVGTVKARVYHVLEVGVSP